MADSVSACSEPCLVLLSCCIPKLYLLYRDLVTVQRFSHGWYDIVMAACQSSSVSSILMVLPFQLKQYKNFSFWFFLIAWGGILNCFWGFLFVPLLYPITLLMQILNPLCVQGRFRVTAEMLRLQLKLQQWVSIVSDSMPNSEEHAITTTA